MWFWCKTISLSILANQHSYQSIFSLSYQNIWDLITFIPEADRVQQFVDQWNQIKVYYIVNFLHSRKPYFNDFSASMKIITELIELYFVKLQFMVVIKIIHFVFFCQYSISFICTVYCISLSVTISLFIFIYVSFFFFFLNTFFFFLFSFLLNFNFLLFVYNS